MRQFWGLWPCAGPDKSKGKPVITKVMSTIWILALLLVLGMPWLTVAAEEVVSARLAQVLAEPAGPFLGEDGIYGIWVNFTDRNLGGAELAARLSEVRSQLSERTLNRRAKAARFGEETVTESDLPLAIKYLDEVSATGAEFRRESRWLNAASFNATAEQIETIKELPFVASLDSETIPIRHILLTNALISSIVIAPLAVGW